MEETLSLEYPQQGAVGPNMFAGSHLLTIDDKGRMAIPSRVRQQLADNQSAQVFITRSYESCLEIYPAAAFHDVAEQIQNLADRRAADKLNKILIGNAVETEIDKQGRVLLPQLLRKFARLGSQAVLVGQIRRLDLWAEDLWTTRFGEGAGSPEELADVFSLIKR